MTSPLLAFALIGGGTAALALLLFALDTLFASTDPDDGADQ